MVDTNQKILVLGSNGFVGKNIVAELQPSQNIVKTTRIASAGVGPMILFDISNMATWENIKKIRPTIIINCIGYGVVKTEKDTEKIYDINYFKTVAFYDYLSVEMPEVSILHVGTAFEYDLSKIQLSESTPTLPLTHYGISKLMASKYLLQKKTCNKFIIVRPFNMFGFYEDNSKIIPSLILAQKTKIAIELSSGLQRRDFFFIGDFSKFISKLINIYNFDQLPQIINVGTGNTKSIKELSNKIAELLPTFDPSLWKWNSIPQRVGENNEFFNSSTVSKELGFECNTLENNLQKTIDYYLSL